MKRAQRWPVGLLILLAVATLTMAAAPAAEARAKKPQYGEGIDASHWQGAINWTRVAGASKKFVYLKTTEGTTYVDPTFASNRSGARAAGIKVGAYHFARPDRRPVTPSPRRIGSSPTPRSPATTCGRCST